MYTQYKYFTQSFLILYSRMFSTLLHTSSSFYGDTCSKTLKMSTSKYIIRASYPGPVQRRESSFSPPNLPSHLCKSLYLNSTKMYISVRVSIVSDAAALVPSYLPSLKPKSQSSLGSRLLPSQPSVACRAG